MKLRKPSKIIVSCLIVLILFYLINKKDSVVVNELDKDKIEDFDIILSKGQSVQSKLISLLKLSTKDYSHIGIMIKENNKVFVLHSTPDGTKTNGIRFDNLQTFIDLSSVSEFIILRHQDLSLIVRQKLKTELDRFKTIQAPFDYDFNNYENQKIYCSELVWLIFNNVGLFKTSDLNLKKTIYPKYFLKIKQFEKVDIKKTSP
ncbi:MAG: hypothetical protein HQ541_04090 [Mariniphaga sp.]|nr:hypothetical protein [Mariniphaga sp.]